MLFVLEDDPLQIFCGDSDVQSVKIYFVNFIRNNSAKLQLIGSVFSLNDWPEIETALVVTIWESNPRSSSLNPASGALSGRHTG